MTPGDATTGGRLVCVGLVGQEMIDSPRGRWEGWGGAALYASLAAAAAGVDATILTGMTRADATAVRKVLSASGVDLDHREIAVPCRFHLTYDDGDELRGFSYDPGSMGELNTGGAIASHLRTTLESGDVAHVHLCPLPQPVLGPVASVILSEDVPFSVQVHFSEIEGSERQLQELHSRAKYAFMNASEAELLYGPDVDRRFGGLGFVTDRFGVTMFPGDRRFVAERVTVVDPTGAGDAFAGALIARALLGDDLQAAVGNAIHVAARTVQHPSTTGFLN